MKKKFRKFVIVCSVVGLTHISGVSAEQDSDPIPVNDSENAEVQVGGADTEVVELESTDAEVVDSEITDKNAWPADLANGDLPMAGIFYGNGSSGRGTANSLVSDESSRRFRAEKTGDIVSYTYNNRLLRNSEINSRCTSAAPNSVWCRCKNAGLDENQCGYTLSNSYHVGNGGTIVVELRPDDGNGLPSETVLGKTEQFIPTQNRDKWFAKLNFTSPTAVEAGKIYHLVHTNLTPPSRCGLGNNSVSRAANCPRNEGAQGLNGSYYSSYSSTTGRFGPFRGSLGAATLYRRHKSSEWTVYERSVSFYEVGYSDGVSVGDAYHSYDSTSTQQVLGGSVRARQSFTVNDLTRNVNGLWLSHGHRRGANGSDLAVELKDESGKVLATGSVIPSEYCMSMLEPAAPSPGGACRDWGYTDLSSNVALLEGHTYSLELSGSSGSGFIISTYPTLQSFGLVDRNLWSDSRAEISLSNGTRWREWARYGSRERDMALLFTIVGMPKQLK